jgi:hypothetical protein
MQLIGKEIPIQEKVAGEAALRIQPLERGDGLVRPVGPHGVQRQKDECFGPGDLRSRTDSRQRGIDVALGQSEYPVELVPLEP